MMYVYDVCIVVSLALPRRASAARAGRRRPLGLASREGVRRSHGQAKPLGFTVGLITITG